MTKATEAQARQLGFVTPQGYDLISAGDDAIRNNAQTAAAYIMQLREAAGGDPLPPLPAPVTLDWVDVGLEPGFAYRPGYDVQVAIDQLGMVHLRGHMNPDGFSSGSTITFATLPTWAIPETEVRWIGFQTGDTSAPYGGYFSTSDGAMTLQVDGDSRIPYPSQHFCIIAQSWPAKPAA